jgi:hypothetical protein
MALKMSVSPVTGNEGKEAKKKKLPMEYFEPYMFVHRSTEVKVNDYSTSHGL